jgi:hypothetical protein
VVTTHEIIHSSVHEKSQGMVLKLDYEKTFDKVSLNFFSDLLQKRGFGPENHSPDQSSYSWWFWITPTPCAAYFFKLNVDVLTEMLTKASNPNLIKVLCSNLCLGGVICLQYADDTILFLLKT